MCRGKLNGFFENLNRYFGTGLCYHWPFKTPNPVILELGDSASIYIFLLTGIITAFIILGIELLVKYRNKKKDSTVSFAWQCLRNYYAVHLTANIFFIGVRKSEARKTLSSQNCFNKVSLLAS